MCYPCIGCGICGQPKIVEGTCQYCGYVNELGARNCDNCGAPFPLPPGVNDLSQYGTTKADNSLT